MARRNQSLLTLGTALLLATGAAPPVTAQSGVTTDLAIGGGGGEGRGGTHSGLSVDAMASWRRPLPEARLSLSLAAGREGMTVMSNADLCRVLVAADGQMSGCIPPIRISWVGALVGVDRRLGMVSGGLAAGAAVYHSTDRVTAAAVQARAELAAPAGSAVEVVLAARHAWLPNYAGAMYRVRSFTAGLRLGDRR